MFAIFSTLLGLTLLQFARLFQETEPVMAGLQAGIGSLLLIVGVVIATRLLLKLDQLPLSKRPPKDSSLRLQSFLMSVYWRDNRRMFGFRFHAVLVTAALAGLTWFVGYLLSPWIIVAQIMESVAQILLGLTGFVFIGWVTRWVFPTRD